MLLASEDIKQKQKERTVTLISLMVSVDVKRHVYLLTVTD